MVVVNRMNSMLTISDVSKLLHVHPNTLRRWADKGIIQTYRITPRGDRRFMAKDIMSFLSSTKAKR
jgi:excisionase family DNA binding protein